MEAVMHDASEEEGTTEKTLDGDFALGEDASIAGEGGELEGISVDDEEMKDPEADDGDDEWADLPECQSVRVFRLLDYQPAITSSRESRMSLGDSGYLPDEPPRLPLRSRRAWKSRRVLGRKRWKGSRGLGKG